MINVKNKHQLFLCLCIFPYLFFGCGGKDNSSSNTASKEHIPIPKPDPKPKPDPDPKPKPEPAPTSKLMITASQTNAMLLPFTRFNLGLVNITFTVIPEGKDEAIEVSLFQKNASELDANQSINIDLTSLQDNQYMLVETMEIPTGIITGMTISFSGANSHIALNGDNSMILVDPFLSGYSAPGDRVAKIRKTSAEVFIKTHIELVKDKFAYINMKIDKPMTAGGIDPYFLPAEPKKKLPEQYYMQFVPTLTINALTKYQDIPLVIINENPLSADNAEQQISAMALNASAAPINMPAIHNPHGITRQHSDNDQSYVLLITTLSTNDMPSLAINTFGLYATKEKRSVAMESLNSQYQSTLTRPDKVFLNYRDTFNEHLQANSYPIYSFKALMPLKPSTPDESDVVFKLPDYSYQIKHVETTYSDDYLKINRLDWLCGTILAFTNDQTRQQTCSPGLGEAIKHLHLPLNDTATGNFMIVESGRVNLEKLTILPDIVHQFDSSDDFYKVLKEKLEKESALIGGLEIEGQLNNNEYTVTHGMKVILLSQEHTIKLKGILDIMISALGSVAILSQWLHGKKSHSGNQAQNPATPTP